ncbi:MAG: MoaD/ThiS family protein [Abditibacteriales bacterium]|nr:MoaD/ThiS family protein [Abditibacteriales bacterium]MDW8365311.1 MoaD/ThiS family protein [Abditibacteriales bacterium]
MQVEVKLFGHFRQHLPKDAVNGKAVITLPEGATVLRLLDALGIPFEQDEGVWMIVVNDEERFVDTPLKDGDQVSLFPPLPGG